jgi:hypothetical protein
MAGKLCEKYTGCSENATTKLHADNILCDDPACKVNLINDFKCCSPLAKCSTMTCPEGWLDRDSAEADNLYCKGLECDAKDEEDLARCCEPAQSCTVFDCKQFEMMARKDKYEELRCAGRICSDSDSVRCCGKRAPCGTRKCPTGFAFVPNYKVLLCENTTCTSKDEDVCCIRQENRVMEMKSAVGVDEDVMDPFDLEAGARHMHELCIVWTLVAILAAFVAR